MKIKLRMFTKYTKRIFFSRLAVWYQDIVKRCFRVNNQWEKYHRQPEALSVSCLRVINITFEYKDTINKKTRRGSVNKSVLLLSLAEMIVFHNEFWVTRLRKYLSM